MLADHDREALLRVADRLSAELGHSEGAGVPGGDSFLGGGPSSMEGILNSEDELLVAGIRRGLAKVVAAAFDGDGLDDADETAVGAALDGVEIVMRGEIVMGNAGQLPALLPGFVFLVTRPVVDQDQALELSQRAATLVDAAFG